MGLIAMKCPSCGADVDVDESREYYFCSYCGTKVTREKVLVEHTGTIKYEEVVNTDLILKRAIMMTQDGDFEKAYENFEKVLDKNPECAAAYFGKLMCHLGVTKLEDIPSQCIPLEKTPIYSRIMEFGSDEDKQKIKELAKQSKKEYIKTEKQYVDRIKFARNRAIKAQKAPYPFKRYLPLIIFLIGAAYEAYAYITNPQLGAALAYFFFITFVPIMLGIVIYNLRRAREDKNEIVAECVRDVYRWEESFEDWKTGLEETAMEIY